MHRINRSGNVHKVITIFIILIQSITLFYNNFIFPLEKRGGKVCNKIN
jgi:hypothetical protein